ncbi:MAG TPA: class II aldolase/adducin family protein [Acidimicrobiales bacterium]|jgi:L-ribulose-5-phosphate 4-epimerase|nr:class II aldolase/adducin family protein [Acidimicrobiales bacterium]
MTAPDDDVFGANAWQLSEESLAPELTPAEKIVLLARALYRRGYDDHLAGHITVRAEDDTLLCNPWFLLWDEFTAEDVIRIDLKGNLVEGRWPPPPGIPLHLALHQARGDVDVAVHNHPRWSTTWADRGQAPTIYDQSGALTAAPVAVVAEYEGGVDEIGRAASAIESMGNARIGLLAGHGVFVLGQSIPEVFRVCATFEWRCRRALAVEADGTSGRPLRDEIVTSLGIGADAYGYPGYWEAAVRQELRSDPTIELQSSRRQP